MEPSVLHHPSRRKLLECLYDRPEPPTKSELAQAVYGRSDSSTRAMITRLTALLGETGLVSDELRGRERRVSLTDEGRKQVGEWRKGERRWAALPLRLDDTKPHAGDRPRFHLRHAALLALSALRSRSRSLPSLGEADEHYEQALLALIDEASDYDLDRKRFDTLVRSWPAADHVRILLAECIIRFQRPELRRALLDELITLGELFESSLHGAENERERAANVLLWATASAGVARHHLVDSATELDRVKARGLLHSTRQMLAKVSRWRELAVAASYRIAAVSKVETGIWTWSGDTAGVPAWDGDTSDIARELVRIDGEVVASNRLNIVIDELEVAFARWIGPWIRTSITGAERIFRRVHHLRSSEELANWKASNYTSVAALLLGKAREDGSFQALLKSLEKPLVLQADNPRLRGVTVRHLNQIKLLLGEELASIGPPEPPAFTDPDPERSGYRSMVLNNLYTPEMVAADVSGPVR